MNTSSADFLTFEDRLQAWFQAFWKQRALWLGLTLPVIGLALGFWGWKQWGAHTKKVRLAELGEVDDLHRALLSEHGQKESELREKIAALKGIAEGIAKDNNNQGSVKPQDKKQIEAVQRQLDELEAPDFSAVVAGYRSLLQKYPHQVEGFAAGVKAAHIKVDQGQLTEAAEILAQVLVAKPRQPFYGGQVRWMYIGLLEDIGQYQQALDEISAWQSTEEFKQETYLYNFMKPDLLWAQVRLGHKVQQFGLAKEALDRLMQQHSQTPQMRLALLAHLALTQGRGEDGS